MDKFSNLNLILIAGQFFFKEEAFLPQGGVC